MSNHEIKVILSSDTLIIREGSANDIFLYKGFKYTADSTDSLVALVKSKAVKEECVIAYNEKGFTVIIDDTITTRPQDRLIYEFKKSQQYQEWATILERSVAFNQKDFIDFLRRREVWEIQEVESLIAAIQNFKYVTNISGDFTYDNNNNYTFAVKIGEAEGTVKLPQLLFVSMEVFNESELIQDIEVELEVRKPKSEGEKPTFVLSCPKLPRYIKDAVDEEIDKVKEELEGYLIVAGSI